MTRNEYIVKNCPSCRYTPKRYIDGVDYICWNAQNFNSSARGLCQDCTDCVIKQVIDKCKGAASNYSNLEILRTACETSEAYGKANIAEQILQLFDIEEIR